MSDNEKQKESNELHNISKENIIKPNEVNEKNPHVSNDQTKKTNKLYEIPEENIIKPTEVNESNTSVYSLETDLDKYLDQKDSAYDVYPGAERMTYDFAAERYNAGATTNLIYSTAHIIKGCLGTGILSMHVGFMYGGIWISLVLTFVIGLIVSHIMKTLVRSAQRIYVRLRIPKLSYPDLAEVAFATGPWKCGRRTCKAIRYIVETCLFVEMCGACCVYEIMLAHTMKKALEQVSPTVQSMNMNERMYILCVMGLLILICMIRSLKYLAPFSLAGDVFICICVVTTIYYSLTSGGSLQDRPAWKSVHGMLRFNGICLYAVDGVAIALPVENNMRKPKYFPIVVQFGMAIVVTSAAAIGFFGYWGWGEKCKSPITIHMPENIFPLILQFLLAITLSVTFAVQFWVPFRIVWSYIGKRHKRKRGWWERLYRLIHVCLITCVAIAFPDLIGIVIFLGNFFIALIAFIFPALIECLVYWRDSFVSKRWLLIKNGLLLILGLLIIIAAFYSMAIFE